MRASAIDQGQLAIGSALAKYLEISYPNAAYCDMG